MKEKQNDFKNISLERQKFEDQQAEKRRNKMD